MGGKKPNLVIKGTVCFVLPLTIQWFQIFTYTKEQALVSIGHYYPKPKAVALTYIIALQAICSRIVKVKGRCSSCSSPWGYP